MRRFHVAVAALATQATTCVARSAFSEISSDDEFVSRLDIDAAARDRVLDTLHTTRASGYIETETAHLACTIARFVFGPKLFMPDGSEFNDLVDNNWSVMNLPTTQIDAHAPRSGY